MTGAALYLYLRSLGLELELVERPDDPEGYRIMTTAGGRRALPAHHIKRLIIANRVALIAFLCSGSPDALAVRQEGRSYGSPKKDRKEAA